MASKALNMQERNQVLLEVKDLYKLFPIQRGVLRSTVGHVRAVDGVSFQVKSGETLGLVGESGCGKTTTGRCIIRLETPTKGEIIFNKDGQPVRIDQRTIKSLRRDMQIIFQDPYASLNPRLSDSEIVAEPMRNFDDPAWRGAGGLRDRLAWLFAKVGLRPEAMASRLPVASRPDAGCAIRAVTAPTAARRLR